MIKKHQKIIAAFAAFAVLAGSFIGLRSHSKLLGLHAEDITYKCTIDKDSVRDTSKSTVTGTTDLGNNVEFTYKAFDTRPNPGDYNEAVCFYKVGHAQAGEGIGGWIKNKTAMYGIKEVRVYGYSNSDHSLLNLTTIPFKLYYGYEQISVVGPQNYSYVTFTGSYQFPEGYEVSYIALETTAASDCLCKQVEIIYECEPVEGTSTTKAGPAYQYDYVGKEFTYTNGNKVAYEVTERAPWAHSDLNAFGLVTSGHSNNTGHTPTRSINSNGVSITGYYNAGLSSQIGAESQGRNILSITVKPSPCSWGANFYMFAYNGTTQLLPSTQLYNTAGVNKWLSNGGIILNESGNSVSSIDTSHYFTFEIDLTDKLNGGRITEVKVWSGWDSDDSGTGFANAPTLTIKDLTFKANFCGHAESSFEEVTYETPYQYYREGTYSVCSICGETRAISTLSGKAPWLALKPRVTEGTLDGDHMIPDTNGKINVRFDIPSDLEGRTLFTVTVQGAASGYELFYFKPYFGGTDNGHFQFFTIDKSTNYNSCYSLIDILSEEGNSIGYDKATMTNSTRPFDTKVTYVFDLTHTSLTGCTEIQIWVGQNATTYLKADLRTICSHSKTEEFSNGANCGTRCLTCGGVVTSYVDNIDYKAPTGRESVFTVKKGVTFDTRENCVKTTTNQYVHNAEMGYVMNYRLIYTNIIKNARAAGKTLISFTVLMRSELGTNDIRLGWGVGNNFSVACADHWNYPTNIQGDPLVANNSVITNESGAVPTQGQILPAKQWRVITIDVSDDAFASYNDFWFTACFDFGGTHTTYYPIDLYVSNVRCESPKAEFPLADLEAIIGSAKTALFVAPEGSSFEVVKSNEIENDALITVTGGSRESYCNALKEAGFTGMSGSYSPSFSLYSFQKNGLYIDVQLEDDNHVFVVEVYWFDF